MGKEALNDQDIKTKNDETIEETNNLKPENNQSDNNNDVLESKDGESDVKMSNNDGIKENTESKIDNTNTNDNKELSIDNTNVNDNKESNIDDIKANDNKELNT